MKKHDLRRLRIFYAPLALALLAQPAFALPTMQPRLRDHEIRLGLDAKTYLTPSNQPSGDAGTGNADLTIGVRGVGEKSDLHYAFEGESLLGLKRASYRYVDLGELFVGLERKTRKKAHP